MNIGCRDEEEFLKMVVMVEKKYVVPMSPPRLMRNVITNVLVL